MAKRRSERTRGRTAASMRPRAVIATATQAIGVAMVFALMAACFASCSFIAPEVGKFRGSCKGSGGAYARPDAYAPDQPDPRCVPDEDDDACAVCEDTHCCATRFGCYDDETCACADEEFDECLEDIAEPTTEEGAAQTAHCWEAFSASNSGARARVACQREFCKDECAVP